MAASQRRVEVLEVEYYDNIARFWAEHVDREMMKLPSMMRPCTMYTSIQMLSLDTCSDNAVTDPSNTPSTFGPSVLVGFTIFIPASNDG